MNGAELQLKADTVGKKLDIEIRGRQFVSYHFGDDYAKPFFTSFLTSSGEAYTRFDPDAKEHPHQRSLFFGIGDVNGSDFWNENKNIGRQTHKAFTAVGAEGFGARFTTENEWTGADDVHVMSDIREFALTAREPGKTLLDITLYLMADTDDVIIGATKEAGPLGVRMADELRADRGGRIRNADGGEGEAGCWGNRSPWCLYSGKSGGQGCAIALFDYPENDGYPTYWHVRDYGLMAPNNLFFTGGFTVKKGECRKYRYRAVFYEDDNPPVDADFSDFTKVR